MCHLNRCSWTLCCLAPAVMVIPRSCVRMALIYQCHEWGSQRPEISGTPPAALNVTFNGNTHTRAQTLCQESLILELSLEIQLWPFHTRLIASNCALSRCCAEAASSVSHPKARLALYPHRETEVVSLHSKTTGQIAIYHNFFQRLCFSVLECAVCCTVIVLSIHAMEYYNRLFTAYCKVAYELPMIMQQYLVL